MTKEYDVYHYEEDFHDKDRKQFRKARKIASQGDRSQYKKTDQDQLLKRQNLKQPEDTQTGRVIEINPEGIVVAFESNRILCQLKGALKQQQKKIKNLVAVGDFVYFRSFNEKEAVVVDVAPRTSILSRADNLSRNKEQLIAVNVDQVLITCSIVYPRLKPALVDRYIIAAQKGNMHPVIVVNKIDLLDDEEAKKEVFFEEEKALLEEFIRIYRNLGLTVILTSTERGNGLEELKKAMEGKLSVFSGTSGVGKSSLINIVTGLDLRTRGIVGKTNKGSHTTTASKLIILPDGGECIDTPGIRSFGIWNLSKEEVQTYYTEFAEFASCCKYPNCSHINEPYCAVKEAVENEQISPLRFASYLALINEIEEDHRPR